MREEQKYDFRTRMREHYLKYRRKENLSCGAEEVEIGGSWQITCGPHFLEERAAFDLKRFLSSVMGVTFEENGGKEILITSGNDLEARPGCSFKVTENRIEIRGTNPRGALYGVIHLEDMMRNAEAPFLPKGEFSYTPLTRMRSTHSGSGLDHFPDWQLDCILHAGFTAIDLFVSGIDETTQGKVDIAALIDRAEQYGLDVVIYNYQTCYVHPDDEGAEKAFDDIFGELFRRYPNLWGDLSAGSGANALMRDEAYAVRFLNEFQDRLCFGTDLCYNNQPLPLAGFLLRLRDEGKLAPDVFEKIARGNIIRLLGL